MQIIVTGQNVPITDALRDYVVAKLERVDRHFDHLNNITVVLSVEKLLQKAEATLNCAGNKTIHAETQAADMYAAIDALADKVDVQVKKHKEKLVKHRRDPVREERYQQ
jgi:putative sigma-54 modulation protein